MRGAGNRPPSRPLHPRPTTSDRELAWSLAILIGFVLSGVLLAVMGRVSPPEPPP